MDGGERRGVGAALGESSFAWPPGGALALMVVMAVALAGTAALPPDAAAKPPRVNVKIVTKSQGGLLHKRKLRVRVSSNRRARVRLRARHAKRWRLIRPRRVLLRRGESRRVGMRLTKRGRRVLRSCGPRRIVVRATYRRGRAQVGARGGRRVSTRAVRRLKRHPRLCGGALGADEMPGFALPPWSDGQWSDPSGYATVQAADLDADGTDELIGRGPLGIEAYGFDSKTGQWLPLYHGAAPDLSDDDNWNRPQYYSTIQTGALSGSPKDILVARGRDGLHAWEFAGGSANCTASNPSGCWNRLPTLTDLSDSCCAAPQYYATIQTVPSAANEYGFVWARMPNGMKAWQIDPGSGQWRAYSTGVSGPFPDGEANGRFSNIWGNPQYYSTIQNADISGNEHHELLGRSPAGLVAYGLNSVFGSWDPIGDASGDGQQLVLGALSDGAGFDKPQYYSTIQTGDIDGDGQQEVLARGPNGLREWKMTCEQWAGGFLKLVCAKGKWSEMPALGRFTDSTGWSNPKYYSTIQAADVDGDGRDEVLARGSGGLEVWELTGGSWKQVAGADGGPFTDAGGWGEERYYATIQTVRTDSGGASVIGRGLAGVQTLDLDASGGAWQSPSARFPTYASGEEATAYEAISNALSPNADLRSQYPTMDASQFNSFRLTLDSEIPKPAGVSDAVWNEVKGQIDTELRNGGLAADWYENYLQPMTTEIFVIDGMDDTKDVIGLDVKKNAEIAFKEWQMFSGIFNAFGRLVAVTGPPGAIAGALVGAATSAGLGAPNVNSAIDGVTAAYSGLVSRLQGDFQAAIRGLGNAQQAINGDYGLQTAVGDDLIRQGRWQKMDADQQATAVASAAQSYALSAWQTLTPAAWAVIRIEDDKDSREYYCKQLDYCQYSFDGSSWTLAYGASASGPGDAVSAGARNQLFGETSSQCQQQWEFKTCNLGVAVNDVLAGAGGWSAIPAWHCSAVFAQRWATGCFKGR